MEKLCKIRNAGPRLKKIIAAGQKTNEVNKEE
jgi:hypothetical protein